MRLVSNLPWQQSALNSVACLFLYGLLQGCRPAEPAIPVVITTFPNPAAPGSSTATPEPLVGSMQVVAMQVPGIPDQNIQINNDKREITIQLPSILPDRQPIPTIQLACKGCAIEHNDFRQSGSYRLQICQNPNNPFEKLEIYTTADKSKRVIYRVILKPAGPMTLDPVSPEYTVDNGCTFPLVVHNFADGYSARVIFTHRQTGQKARLDGFIYCCRSPSANADCPLDNPDQVWVSFCEPQPGEYDFEIVKANGRQVASTRPLVVKKGIPAAGISPWSRIVVGTTNVEVGGLNLFPDDVFEWRIQTSERTYRLPLRDLDTYGRKARVDFPAALKPGYHYAYLVRNGEGNPRPSRLVVVQDAGQPAILSLNNVPMLEPTSALISLVRGQANRIDYAFVTKGDNFVRLVSVTNGTDERIPINVPPSYSIGVTGFTSFTLPTTFPAGQYRLSVLCPDQSGQLRESEPLERLIEIR